MLEGQAGAPGWILVRCVDGMATMSLLVAAHQKVDVTVSSGFPALLVRAVGA